MTEMIDAPLDLDRELVNTHNKYVVWMSRKDDEISRLREAMEIIIYGESS